MAAHMMECAPEDLDLADGEFTVKGTDRKLSFAAVANASYHSGDRPSDLEIGLEETSFFDPADCTYPSAIHLCVVLVDPETCAVTLRNYWAVDDVGTVINPMVLHGQVHGGLVQGIGQALMEECAYDAESGQYLSGTFMDYAIPHAEDVPSFGLDAHFTRALGNPLGAKGAGESGTIGAPACICNGVIDALWHLGVRQITQPMTPKKIWRAIEDAKRTQATSAGSNRRGEAMEGVSVTFTVNGREVTATVDPRTLLVHFLREQLKLTGTHIGCDTSQCGACTVHLDGKPAKSCALLAVQLEGAEVTTIEGHRRAGRNAPYAGRLQGASRPAMRLLHPRHGDDGDRHREPPRGARRGDHPPRTGRQPLPMHGLPQHRRVDRGRRELDAGLRGGGDVSVHLPPAVPRSTTPRPSSPRVRTAVRSPAA